MQNQDSNPIDPTSEDLLLSNHNYDGIEEFDNPMPGWWVWVFVACIVWAPIYVIGVHQMGFINSYEDDLANDQMELAELRTAYETANPVAEVTSEAIAAYIGVAEHIEAGAAIFTTNCAMCHGALAEGLIGPNLTDDYWIHGGTHQDLFHVITEGVLEKGMTPWGAVLSVEQRMQLVSFIRSIHGSNPPGAKPAQGELVTPNG